MSSRSPGSELNKRWTKNMENFAHTVKNYIRTQFDYSHTERTILAPACTAPKMDHKLG